VLDYTRKLTNRLLEAFSVFLCKDVILALQLRKNESLCSSNCFRLRGIVGASSFYLFLCAIPKFAIADVVGFIKHCDFPELEP
jgi:hypothetical protein